MKAERIAIVCIILALFFTAVAPAPAEAAPSQNSLLTITNKTPGPVTITLTGPKTYTIVAVAGKTTKEVVRGQYNYTYQACGMNKKGNVSAGGGKSKLNVAACQTGKIRFFNLSSTTLTISMTGPQTMRVTVPPKSYQDVTLFKGEYQWRASWCNQTKNFTVKVSGKKNWYFWGC